MPKNLAELIARTAAAFSAAQTRQLINVVVAIAHADLHIDDEERAHIQLAIETAVDHPITPEEVAEHIREARKRIAVSGGIRFAQQVGQNLREAKLGRPGAELAFAIAASGGISSDERLRLDALVAGAGLTKSDAAQIERDVS